MLTQEQIQQFQFLYKKHFGEEIGREEAFEKGMRLVNLMRLIYKPTSEDESETNLCNQS